MLIRWCSRGEVSHSILPWLFAVPRSRHKDEQAFHRHLRHHVLTLVTALSRYQTETALGLIELTDSDGKPWSNERLLVLLNTYHDARHQIRLDPEARNPRHTHLSEDRLTIHQTLIDPDDLNDWSLHLVLDLEKSNVRRLRGRTANAEVRTMNELKARMNPALLITLLMALLALGHGSFQTARYFAYSALGRRT